MAPSHHKPRLSQVCDNWRNLIISTPVLWRRLDLTGFSDVKFPLQSFQRLNDTNQLFTCVNELNLSGWSGANAEKIIEIVANSSNFDLEMLCVRNCRNISCKFLDTVIRRCPNIKDLDISAITVCEIEQTLFFRFSHASRGLFSFLFSSDLVFNTCSPYNCGVPLSLLRNLVFLRP